MQAALERESQENIKTADRAKTLDYLSYAHGVVSDQSKYFSRLLSLYECFVSLLSVFLFYCAKILFVQCLVIKYF